MKYSHIRIPALLLLALFVFSVSHGGSFLLDDVPNLKTLERLSDPLTFEAVSSVLFTNSSGAFGRIIPMASFVLQYQSWPQDATAFRMVSIAIHLFNGLLVWFFTRKILASGMLSSRSTSTDAHRNLDLITLAATAIWLLHPLQVSTVLYIVQRSAELSATFTLAGLLLYLRGREFVLANHHSQGYVLMGIGAFGMTFLATLCKENGVLLPLYILLLESTVLERAAAPAHFRQVVWAALGLPILVGIWFIATHAQDWVIAAYATRDFTMDERLLTEGRVLVDYLQLIVLPPISGFGVFHDDFPISHSLFNPLSTLWCLCLLVGLAGLAVAIRKRVPLLSFAILWFFLAHSMESTVIPLEIYFEHRNYLAILGPAIALCLGGHALLNYPPARGLRYFFAGLFVLWFCYITFITWSESKLWGQRQWTIAETWAHDHPNSLRAQAFLADTLATEGFTNKAAEIYKSLAEGDHHSASAYLNWLSLGCMNKKVTLPDSESMEQTLRQVKFSAGVLNGLERFVLLKENNACMVENQKILGLFEATLANPQFNGQQFSLYVLQGRLQSTTRQTDEAVSSFENAFNIRNDVEVALLQVKTLAEAGCYDDALTKLPLATAANEANTLSKRGYALDIENWRRTIEKLKQSQ
jgi:tetratricopeptide (TPR) repeat protein